MSKRNVKTGFAYIDFYWQMPLADASTHLNYLINLLKNEPKTIGTEAELYSDPCKTVKLTLVIG